MLTQSIHIVYIEIEERHRALSQDAVERLAKSMNNIGLRQPITVRIVEEMVIDGELNAGVPVLVAGAHRLAAAKLLGWEKIDCIEVEDDLVKAEMWEIAENLHRCDLTKDERDKHIRRYAELIAQKRLAEKPDKESDFKNAGAGRGNIGIAAEVASDTGLSQRTVRRALNPPAPRVPQILKPVVEPESEPETEPEAGHDAIIRAANKIIAAWNDAPIEARELAGAVFDRTTVGEAATTIQGGGPC